MELHPQVFAAMHIKLSVSPKLVSKTTIPAAFVQSDLQERTVSGPFVGSLFAVRLDLVAEDGKTLRILFNDRKGLVEH